MDIWLLELLNRSAGWGYWPDYVAYFLNEIGLLLYPLLLLIRWFWPGVRCRPERHTVFLTIGSAIFTLGLAQFPAAFVQRPRPGESLPDIFMLVPVGIQPGFPSTHAAIAFAFATQMGWQSRWWGLVTWALAVVVSWSRVYAGIHYPSDILAGMVLGVFTALFFRMLEPELEPALDRLTRLGSGDGGG